MMGAAIGALVLGGGSFAFLAKVCHDLGDDRGCDDWGLVLGVSTLGAVTGAIVGGAIGHGSVRWDLLYSREGEGDGAGLHLNLEGGPGLRLDAAF